VIFFQCYKVREKKLPGGIDTAGAGNYYCTGGWQRRRISQKGIHLLIN
jgi:hypothetical protein